MKRKIIGSLTAMAFMAAAAGPGIAALAAGGGYIQWEAGKTGNQVKIILDLANDREAWRQAEDIGAIQVDLALGIPEPADITAAKFTFEKKIQSDRDVKIQEGLFMEDSGRFSIILAGNGGSLFDGKKTLELGVLQTSSTEDIVLQVERIHMASEDGLVVEEDHGAEEEFVLKATDAGEDQEDGGDSGNGGEEDNGGSGEDQENGGDSGNGGEEDNDGSGEDQENGGDSGSGDGEEDNGGSGNGQGNTGGGSGSGGGSSSGGGSGSGGGSYRPVTSPGYICPQVTARETSGQWVQTGEEWKFRVSGNLFAKNCWIFKGGEWYYIGEDGIMDRGWHYQKENGSWYYLKESGAMKKGWVQLSGIWYYLNETDGRMAVGWQYIGNKWYYLNPVEPVPVPVTDPATGQTVQSTEGQLPYGAMYQNREVPGGYMTGADGAWLQ